MNLIASPFTTMRKNNKCTIDVRNCCRTAQYSRKLAGEGAVVIGCGAAAASEGAKKVNEFAHLFPRAIPGQEFGPN